MFVLWSFFEVNGSRFWKGSLDGCPQLFSTFISQSLQPQTIFAQLFLHIFPPVSCGSLVHIVLVWMGCLHACSTVICVCSPGFLRGVAQLSAIIVFCSQLCLKFVSQHLRFFVLQSSVRRCPERQVRSSKHIQKCSLEGFPKCHLLNLKSISISRNISWKVPGTFFWRVLSIVVNVSLQNEHTQRKQYTRTPPVCKRSIMVIILWTYFRSPISSSILFHLISVPERQNRTGCPTSLGAWWPVTPGKASATRVVQKWIGAPDPPGETEGSPTLAISIGPGH